MTNHKTHSHPQMEKELGVPDGHCIIDCEKAEEYYKNIKEKNKFFESFTLLDENKNK